MAVGGRGLKKKRQQIDDISQLCGFSFMFFCLMPAFSEKKKLLKAELFVFKFNLIRTGSVLINHSAGTFLNSFEK